MKLFTTRSKSHVLADTYEKQADFIRLSNRSFYVTPVNLVRASEVPDWAGLMEWDGNTLKVIKRTRGEPTWTLVRDMMRYSTRCRRDVALLNHRIYTTEADNKQFLLIKLAEECNEVAQRALKTA